MKAVLCKAWGPPDTLVVEDIPSPAPGKGQLLVSVKASGVNFPDVLLIQNKYQFKPELPFSPGSEIAGVVRQVGEGVHGFMPGDRVMAHIRSGGYAEEVVVDEALVFACASSDEKLETCKHFGAEVTINYEREDLREALKNLGGAVDIALDPVGGKYSEPAVRAMAWKGRYLVVGFASGEIPKIPLNLTLLKGCAIVGVFWGEFAKRERDLNAANLRELTAWLRAGKIKPLVSASYPLDRAADALNDMMNRKVQGKVVLTTG